MFLEYGMNIPVDGMVFQATQLQMDESAMTGESVEIKKEILATCKGKQQELAANSKHQDSAGGKERRRILPSPII